MRSGWGHHLLIGVETWLRENLREGSTAKQLQKGSAALCAVGRRERSNQDEAERAARSRAASRQSQLDCPKQGRGAPRFRASAVVERAPAVANPEAGNQEAKKNRRAANRLDDSLIIR